jgi:pantetheine-phosphate adenylyltransferase
LPTRTRHGFVTASLVREIARHRGDVSRYAPDIVCEALRKRFGA